MAKDNTRTPGQAITGMHFGMEAAKALGLPPGTNLIQIRIGLDEMVEVICRYYPDAEAQERLFELFQRYHVIPADEYGLGRTPGATMHLPIQHTME